MTPSGLAEKGSLSDVTTLAYSHITSTFPNLIRNLCKFYLFRPIPSSTCHTNTNEQDFIFFRIFLKQAIEIGENIFVPVPDWAAAFIQKDLKSTATKICQGIFNYAQNNYVDLAQYKALILNASVWMMEKEERNLDPWNFFCKPEITRPKCIANYDQESQVFDAICCFMSNYSPPEEEDILQSFDTIDFDTLMEMENDLMFETVSINMLRSLRPLSAESYSRKERDPKTIFEEKLESIFRGLVRHLNHQQINLAQISAALSKAIIPSNARNIFVDGVLFSNNRWTAAAASKTINEMAKCLYDKIFTIDFLESGIGDYLKFKGVESICPVKRLALYRASKYLWEVRINGIAKTSDFDSNIENHNIYPNKEEICLIHKGILDSVRNTLALYSLPATEFEIDQQCLVNQSEKEIKFVTPYVKGLSQLCGNCQTELPMITNTADTEFDHSPTTQPQLLEPTIEIQIDQNTKHVYLERVWEEAVKKFESSSTQKAEKAGKYLFHELFTEEEKATHTPSGRDGTKTLPAHKVDAILDALKYFEANFSKESHSSGCPSPTEIWTADRRELLFRKIITETSYQCRKKYRNSGLPPAIKRPLI